MGKIKTGLLQEYRQKTKTAQEQTALKEKHGITDKDVVVIEKSNMAKFSVKVIASVIRICATIVIFTLAVIGVVALLYPVPREELLKIWKEIAHGLLPFLSISG